jgi:site-specific recombinase XerD
MAARIPPVTDEEWAEVNEFNKNIIEEFIQSQQHLSPKTREQYTSGLKIFARYIKDYEGNKQLTELKARHALKYQNWLIGLGLSSNAIKFKRACISSLYNFLEVYYIEEFPHIRNIFSRAIAPPPKAPVREKIPLTKDELEILIEALTERQEWQMLAYLLVSYESGARREEVRQLRKEIAGYEKPEGKNFFITHTVRSKGAGVRGKVVSLVIGDRAMEAVRKWVEVRGQDDCPYLFIHKTSDGIKQIGASAFNYWCNNVFSPILGGRKVFPHLLRASRATNLLLEDGKSIDAIKQLLNHESSETTSSFYIIRDETEDLDDVFDP